MPAAPQTGRILATDPADTDAALASVLDAWRGAGRDLVAAHWAEFNQLIDSVERLIGRGRFGAAAAATQVAANYAVIWHPGVFASGRLEEAIRAVGKAAVPCAGPRAIAGEPRLRILHVATQVASIGGHSRNLWRWAGRDAGNRHSVALTRQTSPVPEQLQAAIAASGGRIHYVNRRMGGMLKWARELQIRMSEADLVVLHIYNQDVIPFIALAGMRQRPPVALVNNGDHVFWVGAAFADVVVNSRISGHRLNLARRGIAEERSLLLPLCLDPEPRRLARIDAKLALGLPPECLVILTIARAVKFRSLGGRTFADAFLPILAGNPNARLVVVGARGAADWSVAEAAVPGQILAFSERPDTATFYEAADVYADSFPFPSITSLLEAGLRGVPLVTRYEFGAGCEVMGADSLGLDAVMVRAGDLGSFQQTLHHLLTNPVGRADLGARTQAAIEGTNVGPAWRRLLAQVYEQALRARPAMAAPGDEPPSFHDLDVLMPFVFGTDLERPDPSERLAHARELGLKTLPLVARVRTWVRMAWQRQFRYRSLRDSWRYLVPEWVTVRCRGLARESSRNGATGSVRR